MIAIDEMDLARLAGVTGVLSDVDDTLSTEGKLTGEAYAGLWRLREAGVWFVDDDDYYVGRYLVRRARARSRAERS